LSYTRARPINYHAARAASTSDQVGKPLNRPHLPIYSGPPINNERR